MERERKIIYRVFDLEGNYVCEGTKYQVQKHLGLPRSVNINDYSKSDSRTLAQKYKVKRADDGEVLKPYEQEILVNQIMNLKRYGNTYPMKNIKKNMEWLRERGVETETKESGKSLIMVNKK